MPFIVKHLENHQNLIKSKILPFLKVLNRERALTNMIINYYWGTIEQKEWLPMLRGKGVGGWIINEHVKQEHDLALHTRGSILSLPSQWSPSHCLKSLKSVEKFEKVWKSLKKCGKVWKSVEKFEKVWKSLEKFEKCGNVWKSVKKFEKCGKVWKSVEKVEKVWKSLKSVEKFEKVWKNLKKSGKF